MSRLEPTEVTPYFIEFMEAYRRPHRPDAALLEACSQNVILFAEKMLGVRMYAWQVDFLSRLQIICNEQDPQARELMNKEFAVMTSRQIGKSFAIAVFDLWAATFNKYPGRKSIGNNTIVGVVSASDTQAKKLLLEIKKLIAIGDRFMKTKYGDKFPDKFFSRLVDDQEANNTTTITFRPWTEKDGKYLLSGSLAGCVIKSYPPTQVVLGETFSILIIDEAGMTARISDTFYREYLYPTGNARDAIRIAISTPWESSGFFYKLIDPQGTIGSKAERMVFTVDAIKIEAPEYYRSVMEIIDDMRKKGELDEAKRAYYCQFVKSEASYFDPNKVLAAFNNKHTAVERFSSPCDLGVDFGGQTKSRTVLTISTFINGKIIRLYHKAYPVGDDLSLIDDIADLRTRFNIQRIIPDQCPAGDFLIRTMKEKGWTIQPMSFASEKLAKYGAFRAALNRGEIESYPDDELQVEMLALQFEHGKVNSMIHAAPGERDDLIDSWVMSSYFYVVEDAQFAVYDVDDGGEDPFLKL